MESAGCIMMKYYDGVLHTLMCHAAGNWKLKLMGFPKGNVDEGEDIKAAAIREVEEETGLIPDILNYIGSVKKDRTKTVHAFVAFVKSGDIRDKTPVNLQKDEIDYAKFIPVDKAVVKAYKYQRDLFDKAIKYIQERKHDREGKSPSHS